MSNTTTKGNAREGGKWYETTLPIVLTIVLSIILVILIIIRIVQCFQERRSNQRIKQATTKQKAKEDTAEGGERGGDVENGKASIKKGQKKNKSKLGGKHKGKGQVVGADEEAAIIPTNENGAVLQSGIRAHPTRNQANKSWYDSKVIPYIDDGGASLDNLYLPESVLRDMV